MPAALRLLFPSSSFAWWNNNNKSWGNGWNNWPVRTAMYWAEEVPGDNERYGSWGCG